MSKSNRLTVDLIVIDTNIFEGMLNPQMNKRCHIYKLLLRLQTDKIKLLMDMEKRIFKEYEIRLYPRLKQIYDIPKARILLRYWLDRETHCEKTVAQNSDLMANIKKVLPQRATTDAIFVWLALEHERILITNDENDIIDEGTRKGRRRQKLLNLSRKSGILTSQEACACLYPQIIGNTNE